MDLPHVPSERGSTVSSNMSEHQEKRRKTRLFDKIRENRLKNRLLHSSAQLTTNRSISKQTWDRGAWLRIAHFAFAHPPRFYPFEVITLGPHHPFRDVGGGGGFRGSPQFEGLTT